MASLIAIDWDQQRLHLAAVRTQRKGMQVEWASDWDMGEELNGRSAEAIGKRLREFLKAEQVTATSVLVSVGRERFILKEVRFPPVAAGEEAALIRFQATKDLTDPPDALDIDYAHRPLPAGSVERHALAVLAKRDVAGAVRGLCRGAGLKLIGVAPRPFGAPYALERTLPAGVFTADAVQGVLTVGQRWAELCLFRGHELLLARSLPAGPVLVGEVKRSLAVFAAQNAADARLAGPRVLYVFGNGQAPTTALAEALPCPVEVVSPLGVADAVAPQEEHQASLAGAVGLAQRWAVAGSLPVNLAYPKKAQVTASPARRRWLIYGVAAGLLVAVGIGAMYWTLNTKNRRIAELQKQRNSLDDDLKFFAQDRSDIDALKEWEAGTVPLLDELYDLTARFPYEKGFRVNHFVVEAGGVAVKKAKDAKDAKEAPTAARVKIIGINPPELDPMVQQLRDAIARDGHLKATIENTKKVGLVHEFTIVVHVAKQPISKYETALVVPADALKLHTIRAAKAAAAKEKAASDAEGDDQ